MPVEDYFTAIQNFFENYKKLSITVPVQKHWLRFSYICSGYYKLDMSFFVFSSGHRDQITCSLLGGFSKPRAEVTRLLDSGL